MTEQSPEPRKANQTFKYAVWAVVLGFVAFIGVGLFQQQAPQPVPGNPAPNIDLQFFDGYAWGTVEQTTLADMQGKIVVLNFWASWCVPCHDEAPILQAVAEEYADRDVVFLGIAWTDTDQKSVEFLEQYAVTYPNAPDLQLAAQDLYRFTSVPETFVIDTDGIIRHWYAGPLTGPQLRGYIDDVLGG